MMDLNQNSLWPDRRQFAKAALGGAALLASAGRSSATLRPIPPGIKIGTGGGQPTEENMLYLKQLGVKWVSLAASQQNATAEGFTQMREQWEAGGFKVYNIGSGVGPSGSLHNMPEVTLNLPGRDQKIEEYLNYIRYLGKAGIPYSTYAHMGNGIWSSGRITTPRGYDTRDMDMASPNRKGTWGGQTYTEPLSHGRVFSKEEIWENYTYFIKKVVPVAEEAGVRIGIHPDDPPQPVLAGVPRSICGNYEGYKKALEIANSPNIGMCLCVGCWLEGGPLMGKDAVDTIKYFGSRKKLFKVHFRNVSAPLPHFNETMLDDGYYDMIKVMKAMVDVNFEGIAIPDHIPGLGNPPAGTQAAAGRGAAGRGSGAPFRPNPGLAYLIGSMQSMLKAAQS
ncbi:MAG: mannonate dehydratase, partial [Verrucomicrobia bacterium]|nr:mannonate dehydratase [Verrucomicrobiota bacterium]